MYDHVWKSERQKAVEVQFRNLLKKGINFTLVGVVGAIFDYGTRFILLHFGVPAFIARGSSYIVGSTVAYYLNSFFTFKGDRSAAEKTRATISYIVCFCTAVFVDMIVRHTMADVPHVLTISWVISQAAATILNFSKTCGSSGLEMRTVNKRSLGIQKKPNVQTRPQKRYQDCAIAIAPDPLRNG